MEHQRTINIILTVAVIVLSIIVFKHITTKTVNLEGFEVNAADLEAIRNVSSLYNKDSMKISNLEVTNTLTVGNSANVKNVVTVGDSLTLNGTKGSRDKISVTANDVDNSRLFFNNDGVIGIFKGNDLQFSAGKFNITSKVPLVVNNTATVNGLFTANNGSRFSGGRHSFEDEEKAGPLRVGAAWGMPGIYAEGNKNLVIGSSSGVAMTHPQQYVMTSRSLRTPL